MKMLKIIKIELWVLCLVGILFLIGMVGFGALVRQEVKGPRANIPFFSNAAIFLAEIPYNIKRIVNKEGRKEDFITKKKQLLPNISGFQGSSPEEEAYLLLSRYNRDAGKSVVELVDLRTFQVKKEWHPDIDQINKLIDPSLPDFENIERDKNISRYEIIHPFLTEDGGLIFKSTSPLVKVDKNSQLVWLNQEDQFHHSIEKDYEGNFWVPTHSYPYQVDKRIVGLKHGSYLDDAITKVSPEGKILFQKSVTNILIENNYPIKILFNDHHFNVFHKDPIHLNDIQPVLSDGPHWKRGDVFLSLRHQSMIILYRPSTNKIIWKGMGHNAAQHDVNILDDHRISIFDNNVVGYFDGNDVDGNNKVLIYDFKTDSYSEYFNEMLKQYDVKTVSAGRGQILDSLDLFIESSNQGRLLYFNKDRSLQWQYINRAKDNNVSFLSWSRILYKPEDIKKVRKIIKNEKVL